VDFTDTAKSHHSYHLKFNAPAKELADKSIWIRTTCVANDRLLDKVINDVQSGQMLGVRFTPTVFINEQNYGNPGGADAIAAILRQVGR
jgi:protein-disulfide isomerase